MGCRVYKILGWSRASIEDLAPCNPANWAIYYGEVHERGWSIECSKRIVEATAGRGAKFLALEHFTYEDQEALDEWSRGAIDWDTMKDSYTGGFNIDLYKPLLEEARSRGLRLLALFPPRRIAALISHKGVEGLREAASMLPQNIRVDPELILEEYKGYRERILSLIPRRGPMARLDPERIVMAQAFKDTVAASIVSQALQELGPGVVVAGWVHVEVNGSIPSRVERLNPQAGFLSVTSRESGLEEARREIGEWLWATIASYLALPVEHGLS